MNIEICDFCKNVNKSTYQEPCKSCNVLESFSDYCYFEPSDWAKEAFEEQLKEIKTMTKEEIFEKYGNVPLKFRNLSKTYKRRRSRK